MDILELERSLYERRLIRKKLVADLNDCDTDIGYIKLQLDRKRAEARQCLDNENDEERATRHGFDD